MPELPPRPSCEHLRKEAKRAARKRSMPLAETQRALAQAYGFKTWPLLMRHVARISGDESARSAPLFAAVRSGDVEAVRSILAVGANPRLGDGTQTPLHVAARLSSPAVIEALIAGGALEWQTNDRGETPLDVAQRSRSRERTAIVALLDRSWIADASFRAAVAALHAGDVCELARLIDAEPRLLHERILGPEAYRMAPRDHLLPGSEALLVCRQ